MSELLTKPDRPMNIDLLTICKDLVGEVVTSLHNGEAMRAALSAGELRARIRELEAAMWDAFRLSEEHAGVKRDEP